MYREKVKSSLTRRVIIPAAVCCMAVMLMAGCCCTEQKQTSMRDAIIKVAVVTGGHDYEREPFFEMFDAFKNIGYVHAQQRDDSEIFENIDDWDFDVIVLYNMTQRISEQRQENFKKLLKKKGVGLVAVHHSIAAFQNWDEYPGIIGGKYFLEDRVINGVFYKRGDYRHDVRFSVYVENKKHPVTKGLNDFEIQDETYKNYVLEKGNNILLTTDAKGNERQICWARGYGRARVCYIQLGHGRSAFEDANYRKLLSQAIIWSAGGAKK